jgi:hypothetical protein
MREAGSGTRDTLTEYLAGQRVGKAGEEAPHVAVTHALDHLRRQADQLGLEQSRGPVPISRFDEATQALGSIWGRSRP